MDAFISLIPLLVLLACLLVFKLSTIKSGALAVLSAIAVACFYHKMNVWQLSVSISKGMSLALYVLLIIWSAIFLYQLVFSFHAIDVINKNIILFIKDKFVQFLILAWLFSSILQGIAGFGVPVVIVVPILINLGFDPLASSAAVLLGHSWSVSFGSMGSSFYAITLVTELSQQDIGYAMGIFDIIAMIIMGFSVCFIYAGWKGIKNGMIYVLPSSAAMIAVLFSMVYFNQASLIGLVTALAGLVTMYLVYILKEKVQLPKVLYKKELTLLKALFPYILIVVLSILFQMLDIKHFSLSFRYPAFSTALGYIVPAESAYAKISIFGHPAPIIMCSALGAALIYWRSGIWSWKKFKNVVKETVDICVNTSIGLIFLITTALIMMDSGMTHTLAVWVAGMTGSLYPVFAPFFGVLGSFITGSNTNSNVIFGKFQISVAQSLNISPSIMAGLQSISGSIGVSLGPTNMLMASSSSGLSGQESAIYRRVIPTVLITALLLGLFNYILLFVL